MAENADSRGCVDLGSEASERASPDGRGSPYEIVLKVEPDGFQTLGEALDQLGA